VTGADEIAEVVTGPEADPAAARMPRVRGEAIDKLPDDLYIPPDALEVILEAFEGPLDLLLYLIRRQNLDILDIPILQVTRQYMQYIDLMQTLKLELAAEYLLMAAWLAEIKSRVLLPRPPPEEEDEGDPRMALVRRLQEYERFKNAAEQIERLPRAGRDFIVAQARPDVPPPAKALPVPNLREMLEALRDALDRARMFTAHSVSAEPLSVRERMSRILSRLRGLRQVRLVELLDPAEGKPGVVVSFLAILELTKGAMLEIEQAGPFADIVLRPATASQDVTDVNQSDFS
jgi:segregation and condensation protein A